MDTRWIMLGLLIVLGGTFIPGAVVVVDTVLPRFYLTLSNPQSNNPDAPSVLTASDGGVLVWTAVADVTGVETVSVTVTGSGYASGKQLCTYDRTENAANVDWDIWEWQTPALDIGVMYTFEWEAVEAEHGRMSWGKTYGIVPDMDGYFVINGQEVTSTTQVISTNQRELNVEYVATNGAEFIDKVEMKVFNSDGLNLKTGPLTSISDTKWASSPFYTFTADGYYTVKGYITAASQTFLEMSLMHEVGVTPDPNGDDETRGFLSRSWPYQVFGGLIVLNGIRKKKPEG